MDQVQIQLRQLQVGQGLGQGGPHLFRAVAVVPELGGDPKLLPPHHAVALRAGQGRADLGFVAVDRSAVDVAVAQLDGRAYRGAHRARA